MIVIKIFPCYYHWVANKAFVQSTFYKIVTLLYHFCECLSVRFAWYFVWKKEHLEKPHGSKLLLLSILYSYSCHSRRKLFSSSFLCPVCVTFLSFIHTTHSPLLKWKIISYKPSYTPVYFIHF